MLREEADAYRPDSARLRARAREGISAGAEGRAGSRRTLPEADFTVAAREEGGAPVYRWALREGRTVPAGEHVFAVRYDHAAGVRDAGRDAYTAAGRRGGRRRAHRPGRLPAASRVTPGRAAGAGVPPARAGRPVRPTRPSPGSGGAGRRG